MNDEFKVRDLRNKQFFMVDDAYLNGYARLCGWKATLVYMALCRHSNKNQVCFPSKKLMAEELDISERSVYNAIKTLESWGIIRIQKKQRKNDGKYMSLIYVLADKKTWKSKPTAYGADGTIVHTPSAKSSTNQRHHVPSKETHEGNTIKERVLDIEKYKPDFIRKRK